MEDTHKYIKNGFLDIRLRLLFLLFGLVILMNLRPLISQQSYNRALTFYQTGNLKKAAIHSRRALWLFPKFITAYNLLGRIYEKKGNYGKAVATYKKSLQIDPKNTEGCLLLGAYYATKIQNYSEAAYWFKEAIATDEKNWTAYRWLIICYNSLGLTEEALAIRAKMKKIGTSPRPGQNQTDS